MTPHSVFVNQKSRQLIMRNRGKLDETAKR